MPTFVWKSLVLEARAWHVIEQNGLTPPLAGTFTQNSVLKMNSLKTVQNAKMLILIHALSWLCLFQHSFKLNDLEIFLVIGENGKSLFLFFSIFLCLLSTIL